MSDAADDAGLGKVLFDAALQSRFMQARRNDLIAEKEQKTKFVYGVDTNVIRYWGNPRSNAPERPNHPGRIFRGDESDLVTSLAWDLLNYVFETLGGGNIPLLLVPPMETEVASMFEALHDADPEHPSPEVQKKIGEVLTKLQAAIPAETLSALTIELQDLLFQEIGEHAELRRMLLLFSRRRVQKLDDATLPEGLRKTLLPTENILNRWIEYSKARSGGDLGWGRTEGWDARLKRAGHLRSKELREIDAEVLARIEVWNHHLIRQKSPWRFLYLTADMRLFEAAADHTDFEGAEGRTFADAYLRHPKAYLSEDGVLGGIETYDVDAVAVEGESVGDWLRMATYSVRDRFGELFKGWREGVSSTTPDPSFEDIVQEAGAASAADLAASLLKKWRAFAQNALVVDPTPKEGLFGLTRDRLQPAEVMLELVMSAHQSLEAQRRATLRQYLLVTTKLGQTLEAQKSSRLLREVPPIYFEDWRDAGRAVVIMSQWPHDFVDDEHYREVEELIANDDETSYAFYLCFGLQK